MGGINNDRGFAMALDDLSNVYTTGQFETTADFDPGPGTYTLTEVGAIGDAFVSKLDSSGNFIYAKQLGGSNSYDVPQGIFVDRSRNVYTTGSFNNPGDFDPGPSSYSLIPIGVDAYISKLDANGNFAWAKQLGGSSSDAGYGIGVDTLGNVYTGGIFQSTADFDPGVGTFTLTSYGMYDMFISKLDISGNFIWAKQIGSSFYDDYLQGLTVDKKENVYTTGYFFGSVDFDPNAGVYTMTATPGGQDAFIHKLGLCPAPINTTSSGNLSVCSNTTILSASGTGTINWYATPTSTTVLGTGSNYVTPFLAPGLYTYFVEAINSCTINPVRTAVQVIVNAIPNVSITTNNSLICSGQSATLTANGASTYTWNTAATISIIVVTPTTTITYSVVGKDVNGCQNTYSLIQNVSACTGINTLALSSAEIYPNPFTDNLIIQIPNADPGSTINLYNNLGQLVFKSNTINNENKINTSQFPSGIYLLEIKTEGKIISKKIIKQ